MWQTVTWENIMPYAILWTACGNEFEVERKLIDIGMEAYCPRVNNTVRNRKSKSAVDKFISWTKPLFPGYVLLKDTNLGIPSSARVKAKFLMMGDRVLVVSEEHYNLIRQQERELSEGQGNGQPVMRVFMPGDTVSVVDGALRGKSGRVMYVHKSIAKVVFRGWPLEMSVFTNNLQPTDAVL